MGIRPKAVAAIRNASSDLRAAQQGKAIMAAAAQKAAEALDEALRDATEEERQAARERR